MKTGLNHELGFTIIETIIFLAVSSALVMTAIATLSGQQRKTEFNQGIRDIESQLRDVVNDVSTGLYENGVGFSCSVPPSGRPTFTSTSAPQGSNSGCLIIGRVVQFAPGGDKAKFVTYNVAGRQKTSTIPIRDVQGYSEAFPTAIAPSTTSPIPGNPIPDTSVTFDLPYGITMEKMCYTSATCVTAESTAFGIFSGFGSSSGGNLLSGIAGFNLLPLSSTTPSETKLQMVDSINAITDTNNADQNPSNGVILCFKSGGTNQYGKITIGGNSRQESLTLDILGGTCQ